MELLHVFTNLLVWYVKLVKSTLPVLQLASITVGTLAAAAVALYAIYVRGSRCHDIC